MSGRNGEDEGQSPSSVVTVSTPPQSLPSPTLSDRKLKDKCFRCGMKGHWAQDCPFANPTKNASSLPDVHHFPVLRCPCGVAFSLRVSGSETHYGRRYYARNCNCGNGPGKNFYKWCEDVKAPLCKCGAGACTINFHEDTHGNSVKYYTCRIRTGHGSCGFLQFDSPPNSWPRSRRPISSLQHGEPPDMMSDEDECSIPCFSNTNILVHEAETSDFVVGKGNRVSRLMSCKSSVLMLGKTRQIMGLRVHGWVGRLAFPPPRILSDLPLGHFFCCKHVSQYADISIRGSSSIMPCTSSNGEVDEESQNALRNDTQLLAVPSGTSIWKRSFTAMQGVPNMIVKGVGKNLQKDCCLLLSMEAAKDGLAFAEHVTKSIQYISSVTGMGLNCNQQEPTIQKNIKEVGSDYLQWVRQVASHFEEMLHQIGELETFLVNITKDLGQSKRSMLAAYQQLTNALKLPQEEVEKRMAGTTLDEVRIHPKFYIYVIQIRKGYVQFFKTEWLE
ncbi:Zinc finger, CCHC-type [Gossypium australe]|uniref:Zinc finger, CCHC-type n=1 Tax=Gossypium australe TaxID=47621 RepID=A0A5B6ULX6_9ROSI|nr:Zinc finger, CCHC-type [Gossypium australe]